jgi:hypothetical protein
MHSPTIVNGTKHIIVVFQERGILYNKQVLRPGEAVTMTKQQTGGMFLTPYFVHAVIGDESAMPTKKQSVQNLVKVTAIPAAFCAGCLVTAVGAGVLAGPSVALAPLVSGMVVQGVVIDSAALVAGGMLASKAQMVSEMLLKKHPTKFMNKSTKLRPGERYLVVKGGLGDGPVEIANVTKKDFQKLGISSFKEPTDTVKDKIKYYLPGSKELKKDEDQNPQQITA